MEKKTRISVVVSRATRDLLERHVRATGVKKGYLVEQALRHHLQALELPAHVIVYSKLVVTRRSGGAILEQVKSGRANKALRDLMGDGN